MARLSMLLLGLVGLSLGCRSKNPVGFWDIESLSIETPTVDGERLDVGTVEWTSKKTITVVLRYEILDPASLDGTGAGTDAEDDTGLEAEGPAWMPPVTPPLLFTTGEEDGVPAGDDDDAEGFTLNTQTGLVARLGATDFKGGTMTLQTDEATLGSESGVEVRMLLAR